MEIGWAIVDLQCVGRSAGTVLHTKSRATRLQRTDLSALAAPAEILMLNYALSWTLTVQVPMTGIPRTLHIAGAGPNDMFIELSFV